MVRKRLNRIRTFTEKNAEQPPSAPRTDNSHYHGSHDREQVLRLKGKAPEQSRQQKYGLSKRSKCPQEIVSFKPLNLLMEKLRFREHM